MKKTMIIGLCIALIASIIMLGGEVKATDETPHGSASVDKTTLKKGETVTLTVKFPKNIGREDNSEKYLIKFDNEKFSYKIDSTELTGYTGADKTNDVDILALTYPDQTLIDESFSGNQIAVFSSYLDEEGTISGFSVQFEVKEELTGKTSFTVSKLNGTEIEYTLPAIDVNPVEQEPTPAPEPQPEPEATPAPNQASADKDDTPKTGSVDVASVASIIAMISVAGIVAVKKYNK